MKAPPHGAVEHAVKSLPTLTPDLPPADPPTDVNRLAWPTAFHRESRTEHRFGTALDAAPSGPAEAIIWNSSLSREGRNVAAQRMPCAGAPPGTQRFSWIS